MNHSLWIFIAALLYFGQNAATAQTLNTTDYTANAGKVEWSTRQIILEDLPYGIPATRTFTIKNISDKAMEWFEVNPSCVCTSVDFDSAPILSGETRLVKVTYNSAKEGEFYRIVAVKTSFDPDNPVAIVINGNVLAKPAAAEKQ
ncbi:MAG: DUF1573 domain-containing protein [Lewinellaceae bacterium]|nr:DUF1573 domain-containing protein [Lewinellaceae bacterium]